MIQEPNGTLVLHRRIILKKNRKKIYKFRAKLLIFATIKN
jgi:hypothetical protein